MAFARRFAAIAAVLTLCAGSFLELADKPPMSASGILDVTGVSRMVDKDREVLTITDRE